MGIWTGAYVAYGVEVPGGAYAPEPLEEGMYRDEAVDRALSVPAVRAVCPDVGHLSAGAYDQHRFFLVTACHTAGLGEVEWLPMERGTQEVLWTLQLRRALTLLGWAHHWPDLEEPRWFVVTDQS